MSRPMNMQEFAQLLNRIKDYHSPLNPRRQRIVKYVDPVIDMRTWSVFSITFRQYGGEGINFHCQNECRDLPECLFDRCIAWLESPL